MDERAITEQYIIEKYQRIPPEILIYFKIVLRSLSAGGVLFMGRTT
jgi:hypothetical protein